MALILLVGENILAPYSLIRIVRNGRETRLCSPILIVDHIRTLGLIIYPQSATMGRCTRVIASPGSGCGREIAIFQSWPNPRPRNCFGPHQSLHPSTPLLNYQWNKLSSSKNSKNNESPNQRFRLKKRALSSAFILKCNSAKCLYFAEAKAGLN
jgi:hypothetical protein